MFESVQPAPYAFENIQRDSRGGELARLEAQNALLEKQRPLEHLPPIPKGGRVLDVGSGSGYWSLRLAASVPDGEVVCLDRSPELLAHARARLEGAGFKGGRFLQQDLRRLQLEPGFDLIFTCVTLAHVQELEGTLQRLCTALKPGGWILCLEPLQSRERLFNVHPPCPHLDELMERMGEAARDCGSDLSVGLKIAHHLEALGLEEVSLRYLGEAAHGEDCRAWVQDIVLPIARTYLVNRLDPVELDELLRRAQAEAARPFTWADIKRGAVRARRPV